MAFSGYNVGDQIPKRPQFNQTMVIQPTWGGSFVNDGSRACRVQSSSSFTEKLPGTPSWHWGFLKMGHPENHRPY